MTAYNDSADESRNTVRSVSLGTLLRLWRWPFVLLSMVFIPRLMQSEVYGRYALFMAIYFMADMFTDVGILQVFGRFVAGRSTPELEHRRRFLLQGFLVFGVLLAALFCLPIAFVASVLTGESFPFAWLLPLSILLVVTRVEGVLFSFIYGMNRIVLYSSREVLRSVLLFAGVYVFYWHYGLLGALWSLVLKELFLCVIAVYWTRHFLFHRVVLSWRALLPYVRFGMFFYVPIMLFGFMQRSGAVFIQWITHSPEQVGQFDIANQFFLMVVSFLSVILVTLLPSMSAYRDDACDDIIHRWHGNIMSYCGVLVFLLFNAMVWLGEAVISFFLGADFVSVRNLALIMILALVPGLIAYAGVNYAILDKDAKVYTYGVLGGLAVMIIGCMLMIPFWGASGAAWASVAGHFVLAVAFCLRYRSHFKVALKGYIMSILIGICFVPMIWMDTGYFYQAVAGFMLTTLLFIGIAIAVGILDLSLLRMYALKAWFLLCPAKE